MAKSLRVGVMTGGGDCPGLNAVIRAVTKSLIIQHNAEVIGFEDGWLGLIEQRMRPLTYRDVSGILTRGGTILGTSNIANPFAYHRRGGADVSAEIIKFTHELGLDALVAIGGDGTMSVAHGLQERGLNIVGVPKTIDNDIVLTDRTFGFDTAVMIATEAVDRLHTTAQSHNRVMILETMGRYAGWIALYAGVAGGADVILIPEIPYDSERVMEKIRERDRIGRRFSILVVAEGAFPDGETPSYADKTGRYGGIAERLAREIEERTGKETRTLVLGHIQRGGSPIAYDRNLALRFGAAAVRMVAEGQLGTMVALQGQTVRSVPLAEAVEGLKRVPLDGDVLITARQLGVELGG